MFGLTSYDGKLDIAYFYADTIAELANLPNLTANGKGNLYTINAVGVGSKCDCYEDKNVYILKGDNTWQIFKPIESSGGGGSSYTLPTASTTILGGVKIDGTSITINDGVISAESSGSQYTLPTASASVLGGVKVGTNLSISNDGVLSATDTVYILPEASTNTLGGVKVDGSSITINNGVISATGGGSGSSVKIVSWSNGTDAEIAAMLDAHYRGEIDIYAYWRVGDERVVDIDTIPGDTSGRLIWVLMDRNIKSLVTPINGHDKCTFVVGMKNLWRNEYIAMNSTNTNEGGWNASAARTWCNSTFKNRLPATFSSIFKEHYNISGDGSGVAVTSQDYFAYASEKELTNNTANSGSVEGNLKQFEYYKNAENRKKYNELGTNPDGYWLRSATTSNDGKFVVVTYAGAISTANASGTKYPAPFGVI